MAAGYVLVRVHDIAAGAADAKQVQVFGRLSYAPDSDDGFLGQIADAADGSSVSVDLTNVETETIARVVQNGGFAHALGSVGFSDPAGGGGEMTDAAGGDGGEEQPEPRRVLKVDILRATDGDEGSLLASVLAARAQAQAALQGRRR